MSNLARLDQAERRNITMRNAVLQIGEMNGCLHVVEQLTVVMRPCECFGCGCAHQERGKTADGAFMPLMATGMFLCWLLAALCISGSHASLVAGPVLVLVGVLSLCAVHLLARDGDSTEDVG
ncbi:MAG: hypothetical protein KKB95_09520 [Gammaproteobacteria bacterium]|nr:hypothetical protein [Gammaproteobacteria bacterium]MBU1505800.1 hypothetical protein [Gammaproteobacteria bacterium]MBU2119488.1 hypothetical protein [Gammaproteobacteria bacterium]MBU2172606.1 hypothetical protein [Gammaproteobacteria bacterium]MBU2202064.1 hypothetical protein [Gammaproteobacteria bacterium]